MSDIHSSLVQPHGGRLVEKLVDPADETAEVKRAAALPALPINNRILSDVRLLGHGVLSPLDGFMSEQRYTAVVHRMRLENDLVWTIPVTLAVDHATARRIVARDEIALTYDGRIVATMQITDRYTPDKREEVRHVYGTDDPDHPGVFAVFQQGDVYLGGPVTVFSTAYSDCSFPRYEQSPRALRAEIARRGWRSVAAFQTRNPIHRAHEYLQKCALEIVDGLLVHPLVGETKGDDVDARTRFSCYETLLSLYYPDDRVILAAFPASMRYAGPREAIFHALCRKNYGCTHFIVGRDHAGVGDYYGTYDAQRLFDRFRPEEIGIVPLKFEHAFYCRRCAGMASHKTCPHPQQDHVFLSGTKVRAMVQNGQSPPPEFTRPEIARILIESRRRDAPPDERSTDEQAGVIDAS